MQIDTCYLLDIIYGPVGILQDLVGFQPGDLIEKPTAAGIHQHSVALHLHQAQYPDNLLFGEDLFGISLNEGLDTFLRPIQNDTDVIIPCGPRIPH